jgi:hypothetical protein
MAKKEKSPEKETAQNVRAQKSEIGFSLRLFLVLLVVLSAVFLPTAIFLFVGLIPTFVAFFVDRSRKKRKCVTVGAMNLAGCMPFLMDLWMTERTFAKAASLLLEPATIVVIYSAAGIGYLLDWLLIILVSGYVYQRGLARVESIKKMQKNLIERWGIEVSNTIPLDHEGFPLHEEPKV